MEGNEFMQEKAKQKPLIDLKGCSVVFPNVKALDDVSFKLYPGECLALVGENGAGKSTLAKIIIGAYKGDIKSFKVDGQDVLHKNYSVKMSRELGIAVVHQELQLIPELNGIENIFIGNYFKKGIFVDWKRLRREAEEVLELLQCEVPLELPVKELRMAEQQIIQLARAIVIKARVVILDELTAVLQESDIENVFRLVRLLKSRGIGIIYISHRLDEIFRVCDRFSVMCDGRLTCTGRVSDINKDRLVTMMIGRELTQVFPPVNRETGETVLELKDFTSEKAFRHIDMTLRRGEVAGIAGLVGAGKTELVNAVFGSYPVTGGKLLLNGKKTRIRSPMDAIRHKIALIPDERKRLGLILDADVKTNTSLVSLHRYKRFHNLLLDHKKEALETAGICERMQLKYSSVNQRTGKLSGGNQQKIVIGKWLLEDAEIIIFDEPTRGIDVGAKAEIYRLINGLTRQGKSVIIVSPELEELIGLCNRVYIMFEGEFRGCVEGDAITQENIINKMLGV